MTSNETQYSQEYTVPQGVMLDMQDHYLKTLKDAVQRRDRESYSLIMSCIAAINPIAYKNFLNKRKEK